MGTDAPNPDYLASLIYVAKLLKQDAPIAGQRSAVGTEKVSNLVLDLVAALARGDPLDDRHDEWRVLDDAGFAVDEVGQPLVGVHAVARARLGDVVLCLA